MSCLVLKSFSPNGCFFCINIFKLCGSLAVQRPCVTVITIIKSKKKTHHIGLITISINSEYVHKIPELLPPGYQGCRAVVIGVIGLPLGYFCLILFTADNVRRQLSLYRMRNTLSQRTNTAQKRSLHRQHPAKWTTLPVPYHL